MELKLQMTLYEFAFLNLNKPLTLSKVNCDWACIYYFCNTETEAFLCKSVLDTVSICVTLAGIIVITRYIGYIIIIKKIQR